MNKIRINKSIKIYNDEYIIKNEEDLTDLYKYLDSKKFSNYVPIIDNKDNYSKYKYIDSINYNNEDLALSGIKVLAELHKKTSYNKEVNIDKINDIYCSLKAYINYVLDYYKNIINNILLIEYPFSSDLLLINNYYKINEMCNKSLDLLEKWLLNNTNNDKRFVLNHGNLSLEHILINDKTYFISWSKSSFDSPVLDLINFYKNTWDKTEFDYILKDYLNIFELTENELILLCINISIPPIFIDSKSEFIRTKNVANILKYLYKTDNLIRPYCSNK